MTTLTRTIKLKVPFSEAEALVTSTLMESKFGVMTRIDAQEAMRKKIQKEIPPMVLLGACNPNIAGQIMDACPAAVTLLPCGVVVKELANGYSAPLL